MKKFAIAAIAIAAVLSGCVGGTTKIRYTEMPDVTSSPATAGLAVVDCELGQPDYKPGPLDSYNATRCWIVKEGAEDQPLTVEHRYGLFVFQDIDPGRYAITRIEWNATFWIKDERDAAQRTAANQTQDEVPHDCHFVYTFKAWETPELTFEVESGEVTYAGVITINEPATFELTHTERPRTSITRENYGDGVSINSLASYEKRVLEELYRQNTDSEWGDVIQRRLNQLEE
ncbi:MAG: hypothetical protein KAJ17_01775 [Candidatus Krumholzibacteria bacterium]|nr:hypothetical protein [Candidatus Krumholzibacteria bacterium]